MECSSLWCFTSPSTGEGVAEFSCVALPQWGTVVVASSTSLEVHILS